METEVREKPNHEEAVRDSPVCLSKNEAAIVAAAQNGHIGSFELLIERYQRKILLQALRITRNWHDAEDVKQQSILKAFTRLPSFQGKSSFSTWLNSIAINEALMLRRKQGSRHEIPAEEACEPDRGIKEISSLSCPLADELCLAQERKRILYAGLRRLTPALRAAIQLRDLEERSVKETARMLGISLSAVKVRVFQGRRRLREVLIRDPRARSVWGIPAVHAYRHRQAVLAQG